MMTTESAVATGTEIKIISGPGRMDKVFDVAYGLRQSINQELLEGLGIIEEEGEQPGLIYTSLFAPCEVEIPNVVRFEGLVPIDLGLMRRSIQEPIAHVRVLPYERVLYEFQRFNDGESSDLTLANLAYALSSTGNSTVLIMDNNPENSHRAISFIRNETVENLINTLQSRSLITVAGKIQMANTNRSDVATIHFDNATWKHGRAHQFADPSRFQDPAWSVSIPLLVDDEKFVLQMGFRNRPRLKSGQDLITKIDDLRVFAENEASMAWRGERPITEQLQRILKRLLRLDHHDIANRSTAIKGFHAFTKSRQINDANRDHFNTLIDTALEQQIRKLERMRVHLETPLDLGEVNFRDILKWVNTEVKLDITPEVGTITYQFDTPDIGKAVVYSNEQLLRRALLAFVENSNKYAEARGKDKYRVYVTAKRIQDGKASYIELFLYDDVGGTEDQVQIDKLNDPKETQVNSETGTRGQQLLILRDAFNIIGNSFSVENPIVYSNYEYNRDGHDERGFAMKLRLKESKRLLV